MNKNEIIESNQNESNNKTENMTKHTNRRRFIGKVGSFGLAAVLGTVVSPKEILGQRRSVPGTGVVLGTVFQRRANESLNLRVEEAQFAFRATEYDHPVNGDENLYPNKIANFSKTLPHNSLGEVNLNAFGALVTAIKTERSSAFENIPLGGTVKLANPQAAFSFQLDGADNFAHSMPPPPPFASEDNAAEIAEVYWHAVAREISYSDYPTNPLIAEAVQDLNRFARFNGVTTNTIFRGETPGDQDRTLCFATLAQGYSIRSEQLFTGLYGAGCRSEIYDHFFRMAEHSKRRDTFGKFDFRSDGSLHP